MKTVVQRNPSKSLGSAPRSSTNYQSTGTARVKATVFYPINKSPKK